MAWEWLDNVDELVGQYGGSSTSGHTWDDILNTMNTSYTDMLSDVWGNALDIQGSGIYYLGDDGNQSKQVVTSYNLRIQLGTVWSDWSPGCVRIQKLSEPMLGMSRNGNTTTATFRFMVNYATEEITAWCIVQYDNQYTQFQNMISGANRANCALWYDFLKDHSAPPITYTWQSVLSVSGKNGISFLSTIQSVYLNNGDPVNNAPANYIQFADDSNVAILVGEQVDDPTLVTIQYIVPTGTYEYIKLVYKVDSAPTSITDGTAVDILQANRSVTISGIANGNTYFFKIFTDVSESEPYEFTTTKPPIASNYVFELDLSTDGKDIVRYDATKDIGNHKQGELYGSGYTIEDDILTASSWIYWDYDGTENPKFIPANCTLTFEYDAFFPNGEGYLDWYVIDSSGAQQIYWCFDTQHAFQSNKWYNCKTVAKVQNGKIVRYKYVLDGNEISSNTADINMPCVNTETSLGISEIYFRLTRTTKFKNMSIYFDFSEYHDGGGSGSGSSGRA